MMLFIVLGMYQTYMVEHRANQVIFRSGSVPAELPNGLYKGTTPLRERARSWQGKVFDAAHGTGINQFQDQQRYPFKMYPANGLRDKDTKVLRIDYSQPGNPWWLRFIADEIVQTKPGHYLGKVHLKIIPGVPFTLTYFELDQ